MAYTQVSFVEASEIIAAAGLSDLLGIDNLSGGWGNSNYPLTLGYGS